MTNRPLDLDLIRSLPAIDVGTQLRSPRGVSPYSFRGPLLYDYALNAGLIPKGAFANQYYVATAGDGFVVAVSMCEATPEYSEKPVILATEQNGETIRAGVRLVVPGDDLGGRSVFGLSSIEVRAVEAETLTEAPSSDAIELLGQVQRPCRFDVAALAALPQSGIEPVVSKGHGEVLRAQRRFRGVRVWDLLQQAGMQLDATINEHVLRKIVVARDRDGYAVVIATGEIEPRFAAAPFTLALSDEHGPLGAEDGRLRLIAPFDLHSARHVKGVTGLELRDA